MLDNWRLRLSQLPGQFVLNQDQRPPFPNWLSRPVGNYTLHSSPSTTIRCFSGQSCEVLVIGVIAAVDSDAVDMESCPAGQYVAITHSEVFSDAGSLKQAFFDRATKTVASSPRLLGPPGARAVSPELLHGSRPDWYWGPRTSFPSVDFLLPSQWLDLEAFEPKFRALPQPSSSAPAEPAKTLERELRASLKRLASTGNPIRLAMTGGIDSRTLFAAALRAGIEFETYTMVSPHVHPLDVTVAADISKRFGIRHSVLRVGKIDREELDWYLWFSAGQSVTLDSDFHAAGLWRQFTPDT